MPNLIILQERPVVARGINQQTRPNRQKINDYFFDDEYENLQLLAKMQKLPLPSENPILFYPGCGSDILNPLLYAEKLFTSKKMHCVFLDQDNNLALIKTILDDLGVSFAEYQNTLQFYWDDVFVSLEFQTANVFEVVDRVKPFHIYFERAFRIMKDGHAGYEEMIVQKLLPGGILISDSGFQKVLLKKITVPKELSVYKEMGVGIKEE